MRRLNRLRLVSAALLINLAGCSAFAPTINQSDLMQDNFQLIFRFDDNPMPSRRGAVASAQWGNGACIIRMKPDYFTNRCLGHELLHCLLGHWHSPDVPEPC